MTKTHIKRLFIIFTKFIQEYSGYFLREQLMARISTINE